MSPTAAQPYSDCVDRMPGHLLYRAPGLVSWDGAVGFYCVHAARFDGAEWAVTVNEQDLIGYIRSRTSRAPVPEHLDAEGRCGHLPGVAVGEMLNTGDGTVAAFSEHAAADVFDLVARALWAASTLAGADQLVLEPPLPVVLPAGSGTAARSLQIAAIAPPRRPQTLAEAMAALTVEDIGACLDDLSQR